MANLKPGVHYIGISTPFYCHNEECLFVLHKRSKNCRDEQGRWDFGSGQLEFGEDPLDGVLREVFEEYGVKGEIVGSIPAHSILRENQGVKTHWLAVPFFVKVDISQVRNGDPDKIEEISFFSLDNLPSPLHTGVSFTMQKFAGYFDKYRKIKSGRS